MCETWETQGNRGSEGQIEPVWGVSVRWVETAGNARLSLPVVGAEMHGHGGPGITVLCPPSQRP